MNNDTISKKEEFIVYSLRTIYDHIKTHIFVLSEEFRLRPTVTKITTLTLIVAHVSVLLGFERSKAPPFISSMTGVVELDAMRSGLGGSLRCPRYFQ